jgi:hypothetical protein
MARPVEMMLQRYIHHKHTITTKLCSIMFNTYRENLSFCPRSVLQIPPRRLRYWDVFRCTLQHTPCSEGVTEYYELTIIQYYHLVIAQGSESRYNPDCVKEKEKCHVNCKL